MTFFNKKEEVLEVKLTRAGREKLATGVFKPSSYEFLDEDILYDKLNTQPDAVEEQNTIQTRIKKNVSLREPTAKQGVVFSPNTPKLENKVIESLGSFQPYSNYRPAWRITAEDGTLFTGSGEVNFVPTEISKPYHSVGPSYEKIPQLNLVCQYDYNVFTNIDKNDDQSYFVSSVQENFSVDMNDIFSEAEDDSVIFFTKDFNDFTISVEEKNIIEGKDDFFLEVFEYKYKDGNKNQVFLERLYFDEIDIRDSSVGWYFNISKDEEVDLFKDGFTFVNEKVDVTIADDECKDV